MSDAIIGLIGIIFGSLVTLLITIANNGVSLWIHKKAREELKKEKHNDFQSATLMDIQKTLIDLNKYILVDYFSHVKYYEKGLAWKITKLPNNPFFNNLELTRVIMAKAEWIENECIRSDIYETKSLLMDLYSSKTFEEGELKLSEVKIKFEEFMPKLGSQLRSFYT